MYGALDFYDSARAAGIKPIVGCEFYIAEGKYTEKAFTKMLNLFVQTYAYIARQPSAQEQARFNTLKEFGLL